MQKRHLLTKAVLCLCTWSIGMMLGAMAPAHPLYQNPPQNLSRTIVERPAHGSLVKTQIPNNILVLRVQFTDVTFKSEPTYPDFLVHDAAFFDRWMVHLKDFYTDASHERYDLSYYLYPEVVNLPRPMAYYGGDTDERIDARVPEIVADAVNILDPLIDFSSYGGVIIFHAGAGQESDINAWRKDLIWSTFLTRRNFQNYFDVDNDAYQGYPTADGAFLTNVVIVPESQYQDYFPGEGEENAEAYLFSLFGVLAHHFGHVLGLPTLFDNDSSNGSSQGIGHWGLMGTGVWGANGYVPAQVSAWCRMYLGWEDVITITEDTQDVLVDYFLDHSPTAQRLYKVPISDKEYFLIENRQQNPDGSLNPYNGQPSYSFKLLPEGEQEYYENYPELPYFNFMTNRYLGSEWDFFLPGLGGPIPPGYASPVDGSGLLIWHIDENIIDANFTPNFDKNRINGNAAHKGIDLEEADGIQHLDTAVIDLYKYGSPYDSFRQGNNDYFGNQLYNDMLSLPSAESYYGGVSVEIYDIGPSANQMSFSVRFQNSLNADYEGECNIPAAMLDFDKDQSMEIFHPLPDGKLVLWKDDLIMDGFPIMHDPMAALYMWDGDAIYIPTQLGNIARLHRLDMNGLTLMQNFPGHIWASHPVDTSTDLGAGNYIACPLNAVGGYGVIKFVAKTDWPILPDILVEGPIVSNLIHNDYNQIYALSHSDISGYVLTSKFLGDVVGGKRFNLTMPPDSTVVSIAMAPLTQGLVADLIVQTPNSVYVYSFDSVGQEYKLLSPFPYVHNLNSNAPMSLHDVDRNSYLDILIGGENSFVALDYNAQALTPDNLSLNFADSLGVASGVLAFDLDGDGKTEYIGNFSRNRLAIWEDNFRPKSGFPVSYANRSRSLPLIGKATDGLVYAYSAADNGRIYRTLLSGARLEDQDMQWYTEYGNLGRKASRGLPTWANQYATGSIFVPNEVYIYPNPLKSIYDQNLTLNVMTNRDTEVDFKIFDISGTLIYTQRSKAKAYLRNRNSIDIPWSKLSSGIYVAIIMANNEAKTIKFGVEK